MTILNEVITVLTILLGLSAFSNGLLMIFFRNPGIGWCPAYRPRAI